MSYIDLHIHSYYSDGTMSPEEIIKEAERMEVSVISITDHDVLEGSREAILLAQNTNISCISGVELDANYNDINYHILGYGIDLDNKTFKQRVSRNRERLEEVNENLIKKMELNYDTVSVEDYKAFKYERSLGGWKALHYFVEKGITTNLLEGFELYRKYNHNYTCVEFPSIKEISKWIHEAGGKAILAHPGKVILSKDIKEFKNTLYDIIQMGIDGIECYYPSHSQKITEVCLQVCDEKNLLVTSGSDCHGTFQDTTIGQLQIESDKVRLEKRTQ